MAVDAAALCEAAAGAQGSQQLAIGLSVAFSVYTIVAIALSALTIYSVSQAPPCAEAEAPAPSFARLAAP